MHIMEYYSPLKKEEPSFVVTWMSLEPGGHYAR